MEGQEVSGVAEGYADVEDWCFDCRIKAEAGPRRFKGGKAGKKSMGVSEYGGEHRRYSWLPL